MADHGNFPDEGESFFEWKKRAEVLLCKPSRRLAGNC
jgi:hypothetical protein